MADKKVRAFFVPTALLRKVDNNTQDPDAHSNKPFHTHLIQHTLTFLCVVAQQFSSRIFENKSEFYFIGKSSSFY